jgi:tRNA (cmo5U34)-methyltransferase
MMNDSASVGDKISIENSDWNFSGDVSKNFDSHVLRSVPLYNEGHELICELSDFFLHEHSIVYDIGCSTGTLLGKLYNRHSKKNIQYIGLDTESDMIEVARSKFASINTVEMHHISAQEEVFLKSDLIISYYTIQFIKPQFRQLVFDKIYQSLNWGGAFIIFEKVRAPDARFQDILSQIYVEFKLKNNFTPAEIINKSKSLKGRLEPFTTDANIDFMKRAGFVDIMSVFKYSCFEGFIAIR